MGLGEAIVALVTGDPGGDGDGMSAARAEHDDDSGTEPQTTSPPTPGGATERWSMRRDLESRIAALREQLNTSRRMYDMQATRSAEELRQVRTETKQEIAAIERVAGEKIATLERRLTYAEQQEKIAAANADRFRLRVEAAERDATTVRRALEVLLTNGFGEQQTAELATLREQIAGLEKERADLRRKLDAATRTPTSGAYGGAVPVNGVAIGPGGSE